MNGLGQASLLVALKEQYETWQEKAKALEAKAKELKGTYEERVEKLREQARKTGEPILGKGAGKEGEDILVTPQGEVALPVADGRKAAQKKMITVALVGGVALTAGYLLYKQFFAK
jgi:hypothetical protein